MIATTETIQTKHRAALQNLFLINKTLYREGRISEDTADEIEINLKDILPDAMALIINLVDKKIQCEFQGKTYQLEVMQTVL